MSTENTPSARRETVARMREAARGLGVEQLSDGNWFRNVVSKHVKAHFAKCDVAYWERTYPKLDIEQRAHRRILSVAKQSAAAGAIASVGASTGEILSLVTEGLAAPVGLPAALVSALGEAGYSARLQVDLVCDLGAIYGAPFDPDDIGEIATLFGLAFEVDLREHRERTSSSATEDLRSLGLTYRLQKIEDGEIAKRIGKKLLEEAVIRNIVPIAGIAISARWNYVATVRLGTAVKKYLRYRRELGRAFQRLRLDAADPVLVIEACWLLATADGELAHEEMLAIAFIMDSFTEEQRRAVELDKTLGIDEEEFFDQLAAASSDVHVPLLETLFIVAATDRALKVCERRFLRRVGKTIGREIDVERIEHLCQHFSGDREEPCAPPAP